jgi:YHS domain-containing protein
MLRRFLIRAITAVFYRGRTGLTTDPVCGMVVDPTTAPARRTAEYGGKTYYFCAPGCRKAFEKDPTRFFAPDYVPSM